MIDNPFHQIIYLPLSCFTLGFACSAPLPRQIVELSKGFLFNWLKRCLACVYNICCHSIKKLSKTFDLFYSDWLYRRWRLTHNFLASSSDQIDHWIKEKSTYHSPLPIVTKFLIIVWANQPNNEIFLINISSTDHIGLYKSGAWYVDVTLCQLFRKYKCFSYFTHSSSLRWCISC